MKIIKIILIGIITLVTSQFFQVSVVKTNHFNLITANSVFIGFLFTSLSILLGFLNEKVVRFFEKAGALKQVYSSIEKGIICSLLSVILSFINLIITEKYISNEKVINSLYGFEIVFLIITLYYLFKTLYNLKIIVDSIKITRQKEDEEEKANEELQEIIKKHLKN